MLTVYILYVPRNIGEEGLSQYFMSLSMSTDVCIHMPTTLMTIT